MLCEACLVTLCVKGATITLCEEGVVLCVKGVNEVLCVQCVGETLGRKKRIVRIRTIKRVYGTRSVDCMKGFSIRKRRDCDIIMFFVYFVVYFDLRAPSVQMLA